MWTVLENRTAKKQLKKCPKHILREYEAWKTVVELSGPASLRKITGYRDHALKGEWQGARSSYLNIQWRVIYYVDKNQITVNVLEINPHDYG
jgi:addiction module RelE/StbE family toxin